MSKENPFIAFLKRLAVVMALDVSVAVLPAAWHIFRQGYSGLLDDGIVICAWTTAAAMAYLSVILFFGYLLVEILRRSGFDLNTLSDENNRSDSLLSWTWKMFCAYALGAAVLTVAVVIPEMTINKVPLGDMAHRLGSAGIAYLAVPGLVILHLIFRLFERKPATRGNPPIHDGRP